MSVFCCPHCTQPLTREGGVYRCPNNHCFDVAREGYVNLLPANRKHSQNPGDDKGMMGARTRFLEGGYYHPLRQTLGELVNKYAPQTPWVLDAGCGEGYYTQELYERLCRAGKSPQMAGVDLSKVGLKKAARRVKDVEFGVASVYHLPLGTGVVDVLVDCFAPLAVEEYRRVVKEGGVFLYVVPAPNHLMELKQVLYDTPYPNPQEETAYEGFSYLEVVPVTTECTLEGQAPIQDLFAMTPYAWKTPKAGVERLQRLERLTVTADFRIHVFRRGTG